MWRNNPLLVIMLNFLCDLHQELQLEIMTAVMIQISSSAFLMFML